MKALADKIVNAVLFPFGQCRVELGDWPDTNVNRTLAAIQKLGGKPDGEGGMPTAVDIYHFRIGGRRVSLSIFEYGKAYLLGPKKLVRELVAQIAA